MTLMPARQKDKMKLHELRAPTCTKKESRMRLLNPILLGIILTATAIILPAFEPDSSDKDQLAAAKAIIDTKAADAGIQKFFDDSAGYAVFPSVGKGGTPGSESSAKVFTLALDFDPSQSSTTPCPTRHGSFNWRQSSVLKKLSQPTRATVT